MQKDEFVVRSTVLPIPPEKIRDLFSEGELGAAYELILKDPQGRIVENRFEKSKSFVRQFLDLLQSTFYGGGPRSAGFARTIYGGYGTLWSDNRTFNANADAGSTAHGIIVGTSTIAPTINDFALGAQIGHGSGVGQLQYGNMAFGAVATDSTSSHWTVTRDFANSSGGNVTVNEIGLSLTFHADVAGSYYLCIRDVVSGGLVVPNGQTLTVNYRLIITI